MKKLWLFILAGAFAVSCSDDDYEYFDRGDNTEAEVLLKRKTVTRPDGSVYTSQYRYSDNMLLEVTHSDGIREVYYYDAGLLTEINYYNDGGNLIRKDVNNYYTNGTLGEHIENLYDNANVANSSSRKWVYTYEGNTVTVSAFEYDSEGQEQEAGIATLTISSNSNVVKAESEGKTVNYTFDNNNNPLRNTVAYFTTVLTARTGGLNNVVSTQVIENGNVSTAYSTYVYNEKSYPVTQTSSDVNGSVTTIQYTY